MSFQPEERYWTDYLRIALPVAGLLLLIGLLWYWAQAIIGDAGDQPPPPTEIAAIEPINVATPAPTAIPTAAVIEPTPGPPVAVSPTVAAPINVAEAPEPTAEPTAAEAADAAGVNPCAGLLAHPVGTTIQTIEAVRLRQGPSTNDGIIGDLQPGTSLRVTSEFIEAGQCDWWPVEVLDGAFVGQTGFVIEEFVRDPNTQ